MDAGASPLRCDGLLAEMEASLLRNFAEVFGARLQAAETSLPDPDVEEPEPAARAAVTMSAPRSGTRYGQMRCTLSTQCPGDLRPSKSGTLYVSLSDIGEVSALLEGRRTKRAVRMKKRIAGEGTS